MTNTSKIKMPKSKTQFYVALTLSFVGAFLMYAFSYYMREILRLFSIDWYYRTIFTLSRGEQFFYNFFYACFACIIAHNVFLLYLFNRPKQFKQRKRYVQLAGVHNLRFTTWLFVFYFTTIFFDWWMFTKGNFLDLSLMKNYWFFFFLILIVLFFNSYSSLRRILPARSIKFLFISFIGILFVSLSFTFIKLSDYSDFEKKFNETNIYDQYEYLQFNSAFSKPIENISWSIPLFIIKDKQDGNVKVYGSYHQYPIENLAIYLRDSIATKYSEKEIRLLKPNLHFNVDLTMAEYMEIYKEIKAGLESGIVTYALNAGGRSKLVFKDNLYGIFETNPNHLNNANGIKVTLSTNNKVLVNGVTISINELKVSLMDLISEQPKTVINFTIAKDGNFSNYFNIKSIIKEINATRFKEQLVKSETVFPLDKMMPEHRLEIKKLATIEIRHKLI